MFPTRLLPPSPLLLSGLISLLLGTGSTHASPPIPDPYSPQPLLLAQLDDDELEDLTGDVDDEVEELDDDIESEVEDEVEDDLEDEINDMAEETAEDELEDSLEDEAEDIAEEAAEERLDDVEEMEDELDDELEELDDDLDRDDLEDRLEDDRLSEAVEERLLDTLEDDLDSLVELNTGDIIVSNEMLVMADRALLERLDRHPALRLDSRRPLSALGTDLGSFRVRSGESLEALRRELREVYPGLSVDFNHGYELNQGPTAQGDAPVTLATLYRPTLYHATPSPRAAIGMLDGPVDADHPALEAAQIRQKTFVARASDRDRAHGTAVASLMVGRAPDWTGLIPAAELYVASVFSEQARYGSIATTQGLITALDWLVSQPVDVINISLAGPANQTLEEALKRVRDRGILAVAAAGNAGPLADPQYPAAYPTVVAVTAIDRERALYPYAVRGEHLDFSAYGVGLTVAWDERGYERVSGTSFAAPQVTALLARHRAGSDTPDAALKALEADTLDLGAPGKDPLYGHGLPGKRLLSE